MALPSSRNTIYANGVDIEAADLNDLQDMIIGANHGPTWLSVGHSMFQAYGGAAACAISANAWATDGSSTVVYLVGSIPLGDGKRVSSVEVYSRENSGGAITASIITLNGTTGTPTTLDSDVSAGTGGYIKQTLNGGSLPNTIVAATNLLLTVQYSNTAVQALYFAKVYYDNP